MYFDPRSNVMVHNIDELIYLLAIVLLLGTFGYIIGRKTRISRIPLFILTGILFGPVLGLIDMNLARYVFDYVRVFGLVIILFAEGHTLKWSILKEKFWTIVYLDIVALLVTAFVAGYVFSVVFNLPFIAGFIFGAIISATDPATLAPLFHQYKVREDIRVILESESIFNDPLAIVLTTVAISIVLPEAPSAQFLESIARYVGLLPAATIFFLYEVVVSILLGAVMGVIAYYALKYLGFRRNEEVFLFSLAVAFLGFYFGEVAKASGYMVGTIIGIILGNHHSIFKEEKSREVLRLRALIDREIHFNEILACFSVVFIFVLLGISINPSLFLQALPQALIVAFAVILVARPVGVLPLALNGWSFREALFLSLEGPRGVVPSVLAGLPLTLGAVYHNSQLLYWGEYILATTLVTVLVSIVVETSWVPYLRRRLLKTPVKQKKRYVKHKRSRK